MKRWMHSSLAAALALSVIAASYVGAQQATRGKPTAVAVIDIGKVINNLQEKAQVDADLSTKRQKLTADLNKRKAELEQMQADFKVAGLKPGTQAYEEKVAEIDRKTVEFQVTVNLENRKLQSQIVRDYESLYRGVLDTTATVARANSYGMVLLKGSDVNFRNVKPEQINVAFASKKLIYANDDMDITDLVTQRMNTDFKNKPK